MRTIMLSRCTEWSPSHLPSGGAAGSSRAAALPDLPRLGRQSCHTTGGSSTRHGGRLRRRKGDTQSLPEGQHLSERRPSSFAHLVCRLCTQVFERSVQVGDGSLVRTLPTSLARGRCVRANYRDSGNNKRWRGERVVRLPERVEYCCANLVATEPQAKPSAHNDRTPRPTAKQPKDVIEGGSAADSHQVLPNLIADSTTVRAHLRQIEREHAGRLARAQCHTTRVGRRRGSVEPLVPIARDPTKSRHVSSDLFVQTLGPTVVVDSHAVSIAPAAPSCAFRRKQGAQRPCRICRR
jgi:hypothetical protein